MRHNVNYILHIQTKKIIPVSMGWTGKNQLNYKIIVVSVNLHIFKLIPFSRIHGEPKSISGN